MPWQIPVVLNIVVAYGLLQYMIKSIAAHGSRSRKLVWQYSFSALAAIITALIFGMNFGERGIIIVMTIGVFNAFACYCHWRAYDISMSRTSLFMFADDLVALTLGYIVLHEVKLLNGFLGLGLILSVGSVILFSLSSRREINKNKSNIAIWIALSSAIWGVAIFSMSYFSLQGMSLPAYFASWYIGSFVGSIIVFVFAGKEERGVPLQKKEILKIASLALVLWVCLGLEYWSRMLAPLTVVQPIYQVSEMVLPTLIGLWLFKENKHLTSLSWIAIILGLIGGIIIVISY